MGKNNYQFFVAHSEYRKFLEKCVEQLKSRGGTNTEYRKFLEKYVEELKSRSGPRLTLSNKENMFPNIYW